jgi:hypothetical protein
MNVAELGWLQTGLIILTPAIVLAISLLFGRYPGEELLAREPRAPRRRRLAIVAQPAFNGPVAHVGGGLLLGHSLAGRAPPLRLSCT